MADVVIDGAYYFGITEAQHSALEQLYREDPTNVLVAGLLEAFNSKSKYVNGMWFAPYGMIDEEDEMLWVEENTDEFLYVFHNSQQPSWGM